MHRYQLIKESGLSSGVLSKPIQEIMIYDLKN